jgi:UDP-2-acetamido-3-amino-2,3-dideoxy-glucuronate N-acetyltransferase
VGTGATLGANSTIVCGSDVGAWAFVAAGAVVTKDVPAFGLVAGVPARHVGWVSRAGHRLVIRDGTATCPATGQRYVLENGVLSEVGPVTQNVGDAEVRAASLAVLHES